MIACLVIVFCVSCKDRNLNSIEETPETIQNINQITDSNVFSVEKLDFFRTYGHLFPGTGMEGYRMSSWTFFGTLSGNFTASNADIQKQLSKTHIVVSCLSTDGIEYIPDSYTWVISGKERNKRNFRLIVFFSQNMQPEKTNIEQIKLVSGNDGVISYIIGNYEIEQIQYAEPQKAFCFESPLEVFDSAKEINLLYYIAIPTMHNSEEIDFDITISDNPSIVDATILSWEFDPVATENAKNSYSTLKTEKELEHFRVYKLVVNITSSKPNVVIQPYISVIEGEEVHNCRTEPMVINRVQ